MANNHAKKEVDLSFVGCGYLSALKLNRPWQIELLEQRPAHIVEIILLAAAICWNRNFELYPHHTFNLAKKLGLKTRNFSITLVKEHIKTIWANKTIKQLDALFKENLG